MPGRNEPCPCGSGKKHKKCCLDPFSSTVLYGENDGSRTIQLSPKAWESVEAQARLFKEKFGREMREGDPFVWDPDADIPTPISEEKLEKGMVDCFREAGFGEEFIYAFRKTGMTIAQPNKHLFTKGDLQEWEAAIMEYRDLHGHGPRQSAERGGQR